MFDLYVELEERVTASFLYGAARLQHDGGVLDIVREIRERKIKSFFHFSSHLPLTFMFLSAKMGDLDAAQPNSKPTPANINWRKTFSQN